MNTYILCTLSTELESIEYIKNKINIKGIIGLANRKSDSKISGFYYMKNFARKLNCKFICVKDYSLKDVLDKKKLLSLKIDLLLVLGWQRLIPDWLIKHCKICAIGSHGSAYGITHGRGRSPQNWALILGKKKFFISIFKINTGIDSGEIIDSDSFVLTELDDIRTSHQKTSFKTAHMIVKNIKNVKNMKNASPQSESPRYLPQRIPDDGEIDWNRSSQEIYNFVRALTKPYPGAFSNLQNSKIFFWKVRPLEIIDIFDKRKPGTILKIFEDTKFLIKTLDSVLFVEDYSIESKINLKIKENMILQSCNFKKQMNEIINRHYNKFPKNKLNKEILKLSR